MGPLKVGEALLTKLRPTTSKANGEKKKKPSLQNPEETYRGHVKKVERKTIFSRQPQSQESRPEQNQELPFHKHKEQSLSTAKHKQIYNKIDMSY